MGFIFNTKAEKSDDHMLSYIFRKYYFSSVLAIICSCIGNIVGSIVVGNVLGEEKLAVMSLVLPVYYVFATVGNLTGIGGSALCAALIGNGSERNCKKAYTTTCILTGGVCLLFTILFLVFLPGIVTILGTPDSLREDVMNYSVVMILGGVFTAGIYIAFNMLRLDGKPAATTLTFIIMATLTVVLDIVLAPLGVLGISIASVAGAMAATLFGLIITKKSEMLGFTRITYKEFLSYSGQLIKIGSPGATENASILLKSYFFNTMIVSIVGAAALSSLSVINSINSFSQAITIGCAGALVPLVSIFSAERDTISIRRMLKIALIISSVFILVFSMVVGIFAPLIAHIFGVVSGVEDTVLAIRLFAISLPFALFSNCLVYFYLANNQTTIANILTALHFFFYAVGIAFFFMKLFGTVGLWISFVVCEILTILTALLLQAIVRSKKKDLTPILLLDSKYETSGCSIGICIEDNEEGILEALNQLNDFCEKNELTGKQTMLITLSMDEMLHMAAKYSTYASKEHIISIRVLVNPAVLVLRLRYDGEMFNPIAYYEEKKTDKTDIDAMLELADFLGMDMITKACDIVDYRSTFGINNLTILMG